jgi:hypothetical protein
MERTTVTKFDLEAAFKALDEIALPDVSGKGRFTPNRIDLKERLQAKHAHEVLVEDYFDVSMEEDLNDAQDQREAEVAKAKLARIEKIVDLDAESEEDILPSYVGKVIMQCPQCMTLFYKNEEDIEKSEETPDVVNINEICQHCGNSSGYTLVGKVGGVEADEMSNFDLDDAEAAIEGEDELNLDFPEEGTEEIDAEGTGEAAVAMEDDDLNLDLDLEEEPAEEEEEEETNESLHNSKLLDKIEDQNDLKTDIESEHLTLNEATNSADNAFKKSFISKLTKDGKETVAKTLNNFEFKKADTASVDQKAGIIHYTTEEETAKAITSTLKPIAEDLADWYRKKFDKPASTETQQAWEDELNGEFGEISDKRRKHLERKFAQQRDWEARHEVEADAEVIPAEEPAMVESMHNSELLDKIEDKNELKTDIESEHLTLNEETDIEECDKNATEEPLVEAADVRIFVDQSGSLISRKDEIMARVAADYPGSENQIEFFDDAECAGPRASAEAGQNVVVYTNGDCEANCPDLCKIATVKNIDAAEAPVEGSLEAETELTEDTEMDELLDELWDGPQPTEAEVEADLEMLAQEAEDPAVFEEFDDRFDTQVTEYLEDVYSNVDKYESTECSADNKKLIVEGKITFKSGKSKSTKFVFESAKRIGDKLVYRGVNEDLAGPARAFRMICKAEGTKLVTENFKYSYKINESVIRGSKK